MSPNAARHAREIIWNAQQIVGIEMLCAAQAIDFRLEGQEYVQYCDADVVKKGWRKVESAVAPTLGAGTQAAYERIRALIEHRHRDRVLYPDIARAASEVSSENIVQAVERALGNPLG
jgi:histidine ammonia-lyase